ncbi:MAG: amidohydrolase [Alphaproteobacteria bacterium]|nr:amidohydrolase [Alphaproteobacteria bacterium]
MKIRNSIQAMQDEFAGYRRELHMHPQTAYEETYASGLVQKKLKEWGIPFESEIAVTGVVATIEGEKTDSGKTIGLRADMDALDIDEADNKEWKSKNPGKMHACGHDGHTATLLGAAKYLSENRNFNGKVHFIFQPAEEGSKGAHKMIEEGLFDRFPCDSVYGMHNWPYMPKGQMGICSGPMMASADIASIKILGSGGHAAAPHRTIDPIIVGAHIVTALQTLVSRTVDPLDSVVISVTNFKAGTGAHNIIPDNADLLLSIRTFDNEIRERLSRKIGDIARNIAISMGANLDYDYYYCLDATINDEEETAFCADIGRQVVGEDNMDDGIEPSMGAEDFGAMLREKPGAYIVMGQGEPDIPESNHNNGLHTPRYDFNDDILPLGMEYWVQIVESKLALK